MTRTPTRFAAALLVGASLAACGGGDDDADSTTTAPTEEDGGTDGDAAEAPDLAALDTLVVNWNAANITNKNSIPNWTDVTLRRADIVTGAGQDGGQVFAVRVNEGAILGGRIDEAGEITSTWIGADPDNTATASVIQNGFLRHLDEDNDLTELAPIYREVALSTQLTSRFLVLGEDDAFVLAKIDGAEAGDRLVAVSMSNLTDEAGARERAAADQSEVLGLL